MALLQLRARWAHQGGTWSIPGGALERRESAVEAALREAEEELALMADAIVIRGSRVVDCGGWRYETVLGEPTAAISPRDLAESDGHAWVPWVEVDAYQLHPAFREAWGDPDGALRDFVARTGTGGPSGAPT